MASITTWTRLEPRARGTDLRPSLEGRVYDPAWMLARQWQVGELTGEDAGTPVLANIVLNTAPITAYQAGTAPAVPVGAQPIEALAGPEAPQPRTAAEAAQAAAELLVQLRASTLSSAGLSTVMTTRLATNQEPVSSVGAHYLQLLNGRLPDIAALEPALQSAATTGVAPAALGLSGTDAAAFVNAAKAWITWRDSLVRTSGAAWQQDRLEYGFSLGVNSVAAADGSAPAVSVGLRASRWAGDELDWYNVDHDPAGPVPQAGAAQTTRRSTITAPLSGLSYPGMPAERWWQFEDSHISFAKVTADPTDLARMLVVEFACSYSNDWYLRPIELPVGTVTRIIGLQVSTTFGDVITVPPTGAADWSVFGNSTLNTAHDRLDGLLLWPTVADPVRSDPVEIVQFARDEQANLSWALELVVTGQDGVPLDRHAASASSPSGGGVLAPGPYPASASAAMQYVLASTVPDYWFPMPADAGFHFDLKLMQRVDGSGHDVLPIGSVLAAGAAFTLWQEEVPREGSQVIRQRQLVRDAIGGQYCWTSRRTSAGRGPTSSALRYDQALAPEING